MGFESLSTRQHAVEKKYSHVDKCVKKMSIIAVKLYFL